ncbi:hypothetical protein HaLaN_02731, partial [Haematococcus lacustris]
MRQDGQGHDRAHKVSTRAKLRLRSTPAHVLCCTLAIHIHAYLGDEPIHDQGDFQTLQRWHHAAVAPHAQQLYRPCNNAPVALHPHASTRYGSAPITGALNNRGSTISTLPRVIMSRGQVKVPVLRPH